MRTSRKQHGFHFIILLSILGGLALSACGPSIPRAQAEQEVGEVMLDYLVTERIGAATTYTRTAAQPWSNAPYEAGILVLAPAKPGGEAQGVDYLDTDKPVKVWWLLDAQLTEVASDRRAAVEDYRNTHITHPRAEAGWGWKYTEFGILSLSNGNQKARVYVGDSCGPVCGTGTIYTLERDAAGKWTIRNSEGVWIS